MCNHVQNVVDYDQEELDNMLLPYNTITYSTNMLRLQSIYIITSFNQYFCL